MILTVNQKKQSTQKIEEHYCTYVCTEENYFPRKTPKIKNKGGVDINNVNAKQGKTNFEMIETVVERINAKT